MVCGPAQALSLKPIVLTFTLTKTSLAGSETDTDTYPLSEVSVAVALPAESPSETTCTGISEKPGSLQHTGKGLWVLVVLQLC